MTKKLDSFAKMRPAEIEGIANFLTKAGVLHDVRLAPNGGYNLVTYGSADSKQFHRSPRGEWHQMTYDMWKSRPLSIPMTIQEVNAALAGIAANRARRGKR